MTKFSIDTKNQFSGHFHIKSTKMLLLRYDTLYLIQSKDHYLFNSKVLIIIKTLIFISISKFQSILKHLYFQQQSANQHLNTCYGPVKFRINKYSGILFFHIWKQLVITCKNIKTPFFQFHIIETPYINSLTFYIP